MPANTTGLVDTVNAAIERWGREGAHAWVVCMQRLLKSDLFSCSNRLAAHTHLDTHCQTVAYSRSGRAAADSSGVDLSGVLSKLVAVAGNSTKTNATAAANTFGGLLTAAQLFAGGGGVQLPGAANIASFVQLFAKKSSATPTPTATTTTTAPATTSTSGNGSTSGANSNLSKLQSVLNAATSFAPALGALSSAASSSTNANMLNTVMTLMNAGARAAEGCMLVLRDLL